MTVMLSTHVWQHILSVRALRSSLLTGCAVASTIPGPLLHQRHRKNGHRLIVTFKPGKAGKVAMIFMNRTSVCPCRSPKPEDAAQVSCFRHP